MNDYPQITPSTEGDVKELLRSITEERTNDIRDFDNLQNKFMAGRKVGKIPANSADIDPTDRLGDFNTDADYLYIVIDDSGAAWRRVALSTF